jgi:hypothetical protein
VGFNHLEKYESQWEGLSHILWKIKHVTNHRPGMWHLFENGSPAGEKKNTKKRLVLNFE